MKTILTIYISLSLIPLPLRAASFHVPEDAKAEGRYLEVVDVVNSSIIEDVAKPIHLVKDNSTVYILINSPGGSVASGATVLDAMILAKQRGVTFKCLVGVLATSMAFIILNECDERYTLTGSRLMFHPISTEASGRVRELVVAKQAIVEYENRIMKQLQKNLGFSWEKFYNNYVAETVWTGTILASHSRFFITVVNNVTGVPNLFYTGKPRKLPNIFGPLPRQEDADIQQAYEIKQRLLGELEDDN